MAAPRVSRRLQLDDEDGPAPSMGDAAPDSAREASGGQGRPAVLGPMADTAVRGGRGRLDPQPRTRAALAPIRASTGSRERGQQPTAAVDSDSPHEDSDSAGQPEAKPGSRRRLGQRPATLQVPGSTAGRPSTVGQPRNSAAGVTQAGTASQHPAPETRAIRSSDSKFLSTLDSHRPHALPDEKFGAEAKV